MYRNAPHFYELSSSVEHFKGTLPRDIEDENFVSIYVHRQLHCAEKLPSNSTNRLTNPAGYLAETLIIDAAICRFFWRARCNRSPLSVFQNACKPPLQMVSIVWQVICKFCWENSYSGQVCRIYF